MGPTRVCQGATDHRGRGAAAYTAAMKRPHDPLRLDVAALALDGAALGGEWPGATLDRLAELQAPPQDLALAPVAWQAQAQRVLVPGTDGELWLALRAEASVWLTCQRCLQPMAWPLSLDRRLRFVRTEAEAEALDAELDEDVLSLARSINLRELVEDELLLALPLVPMHDTCPQPLPVSAGDAEPDPAVAEAPPNPFAVLQQLKKKGRGPAEGGGS